MWSPVGLMALFALAMITVLSLPLRLPLGPNYWDIYTYVDTAYRMQLGQTPHVDFFIPVGALGYVLFNWTNQLFPRAATMLAVHHAILIVALPLMLVVVREASARSRADAYALVLPFMLYAALPINGIELYPSPGFDAYGNYNRHASLLLYILSATLLFVERKPLASWLTSMLLLALFMTKITGFIVALPLVMLGLLTRRLSPTHTIVSTLVMIAFLLLLNAQTGLIAAYLSDIAHLAKQNTGSLLPRILTLLSVKFNTIGAAAVLIAVLLWHQRALFTISRLKECLDSPVVWLIALLGAGAVFETQNTGSHEFILIWPILIRIFQSVQTNLKGTNLLIAGLVAAVALPAPISVLHRAARSIMSAPFYKPVEADMLGPVGRVSAKADILKHARAMLEHYPLSREAHAELARKGVLPSYILFSETDYQVNWLISVHDAAKALLYHEAKTGKKLAKIVTLDFVDPLPVILKRTPLTGISIGNDPTRTLVTPDKRDMDEMRSADAILLPLCPVTEARIAIANIYKPATESRRIVPLTPCFDMLLK
ncbi:MAG: hypothetical protein ACRCWF_18255 [Beijerinckiaceae bacterium]